MEAKPLPDFSATDHYQVSLKLRTEIRDIPFLVYIRQVQGKKPMHHKLNVFQLIAIYNICFNDGLQIPSTSIDQLVSEGILRKGRNGTIVMSKDYQTIYSEIHSAKKIDWLMGLKACAMKHNGTITRRTYMEHLPEWVSVDKVKYTLSKLESQGILNRVGIGKGTKYYIIKMPDYIDL